MLYLIFLFRSSYSSDMQGNPTLTEFLQMKKEVTSSVDPWIFVIFFIPFVSNPFIYVLSNQSYRKAYKDFFYKNVVPKLK